MRLRNFREKKDEDKHKRKFLQTLGRSEIVIIPTDHTNSFRSMRNEKYVTMVDNHSKKSAK